MQVLLKLPDAGAKAIKYHYQNYKVHTSALPVSRLAGYLNADKNIPYHGSDPAGKPFWQQVYSQTPEKLEALVHHDIGVFTHNLKDRDCLKR